MTQRIFDIENEKDMADLWNILPEEVIKVGQIYKTHDGIMVITQINKHINSLRYDYIYNDGMTLSYMREDEVLSPGTELIAEYPTWQEAVNSKEFKGE